MTDKEYVLFQTICKLSQTELQKVLTKTLKKYYNKVIATPHYTIAIGDTPIALCAHMDTVFAKKPEEIYYDRDAQVIWSPQGLGADDRAGVFIILQILRTTNLRPHIIFTTDEEKGMLGASILARQYKKPFAKMKYIIQLDRRGSQDCVFYDCDVPEFEDYVETFGFKTNFGTFSDISEICPEWGVAGVNLSVGYRSEHNEIERLFVNDMFATQEKVIAMLRDAKNAKKYKYVAAPNSYTYYMMGADYGKAYGYYGGGGWDADDCYEMFCKKCHKVFFEHEMIPVKSKHGGTSFYCPDCLASTQNISWCENCQEAFEANDVMTDKLCVDCAREAARKND